MSYGPIPPHERAWRHPSEVAAEERRALTAADSPPHSQRLVAISLSAFGVVVVIALMSALSPGLGAAESAATQPAAARMPTALIGLAATTTSLPLVNASAVGDARLAVSTRRSWNWVTRQQVAWPDGVPTQLDDGTVALAQLVLATDDLVVLELNQSVTGHPVTDGTLAPDDFVTVHDPDTIMPWGQACTGEQADATPVFDAAGRLTGLCIETDHGTHAVAINPAVTNATPVALSQR